MVVVAVVVSVVVVVVLVECRGDASTLRLNLYEKHLKGPTRYGTNMCPSFL